MIDTALRDECIEELSEDDPQKHVLVLRFLLASPEMASSMLPALEKLLEDRTVATLSLPMRFGEIRNLAAEVVATGRGYLEQNDPVVLEQGHRTLAFAGLAKIVESLSVKPTAMRGEQLYEFLRDNGHLKTERLFFFPPDD